MTAWILIIIFNTVYGSAITHIPVENLVACELLAKEVKNDIKIRFQYYTPPHIKCYERKRINGPQ